MIAAAGVDGLDPCEAPPGGDIKLSEIKKRIGKNICLFGNMQLNLLENGSRQEVKKAVISCMHDAKQNGRYVIMPTASPITPPLSKKTEDNYMQFIETALEFGSY